MFTLTGIVESSLDHTHLKGKVTLKQDRLIFWNYDYNNTRHTHTVPFSSLDWHYWRKKDTAGDYYEYWQIFTGQSGYYNYKWVVGYISFQTWNRKSIWVQAMYLQRKDTLVCEQVRLELDDKSIPVFSEYFSQFVKE